VFSAETGEVSNAGIPDDAGAELMAEFTVGNVPGAALVRIDRAPRGQIRTLSVAWKDWPLLGDNPESF
jgi:hypothetical protein